MSDASPTVAQPSGTAGPRSTSASPARAAAPQYEERRQRPQDLPVGLREAPLQDGDEGDQGGGDEDRRRPEPEDAREAPAGHALAAAFAFFSALSAFFVMKRSVFSCASLSTICTGGDFIR